MTAIAQPDIQQGIAKPDTQQKPGIFSRIAGIIRPTSEKVIPGNIQQPQASPVQKSEQITPTDPTLKAEVGAYANAGTQWGATVADRRLMERMDASAQAVPLSDQTANAINVARQEIANIQSQAPEIPPGMVEAPVVPPREPATPEQTLVQGPQISTFGEGKVGTQVTPPAPELFGIANAQTQASEPTPFPSPQSQPQEQAPQPIKPPGLPKAA